MCCFAVASASLLCLISVGCDKRKVESINSTTQTPAAKGDLNRIEANSTNSSLSEEFADWNLFDGPRVIDPSSEYIYHDCDDPMSSSGSRKIPYLKMSMGGEDAKSGNLPYLLLNPQKVK